MAVTSAIFQRYTDNILRSAVWTATATPQTSYSLTTLARMNPAARIRFGVKTVTLTATVASAQGDIVVIPMSNIDAGSTTVLRVTNGNGVNQAVTIPAIQVDDFPPSIVVDLTGTYSAGQRTSTTWNFAITANSANVVLGGAILVYGPKRTLASNIVGGNFAIDYHERELHAKAEESNEYLTRYIVDYEASKRIIEVVIRAADTTGVTAIRDWWRAGHGGALPGFFWPDPTVSDGHFGTWQDLFDVQHMTDGYYPIGLTFSALAKGEPVV